MWRHSSVFLLSVLPLISAALATEPDREMAQCAAMSNSVERLACFDKLTADRDVATPKTDLATKGDWQVVTETSKIDDSTNVNLMIESTNTFQGRLGRDTTATLFVTCKEKSTHLMIYLGGLFLADTSGFGNITVRLDKNKARTIPFTPSTNNEALGLWSGTGVRLIKEMFGAQHLLLQVTPYNENPVTVEFNIAGLEDAIKPLREACSW